MVNLTTEDKGTILVALNVHAEKLKKYINTKGVLGSIELEEWKVTLEDNRKVVQKIVATL